MFPVQLSSPQMTPGANPFAVLQAQHQKLQEMNPVLYNNITSMMQTPAAAPAPAPAAAPEQSTKKARSTKK
jgi:hypothetical protein